MSKGRPWSCCQECYSLPRIAGVQAMHLISMEKTLPLLRLSLENSIVPAQDMDGNGVLGFEERIWKEPSCN